MCKSHLPYVYPPNQFLGRRTRNHQVYPKKCVCNARDSNEWKTLGYSYSFCFSAKYRRNSNFKRSHRQGKPAVEDSGRAGGGAGDLSRTTCLHLFFVV